MATDLSGSNYSELDASNSNVAPNGMPENMAPSGVNDAWRQGMGAAKRAYDRDHGGAWCTVGGTGNAITLAYTTGPTAYVQGEKFAFLATAANTGATTVNVSGLGAKNVFRKTGAGVAACVGGEIQSGDLVEIEYDNTQFQIIGQSSAVGKVSTRTGLSSGTGATYTTPTGCVLLEITMVGGGGGGGGNGGAGAGNGGDGTDSSFSTFIAGKGSGSAANAASGGLGGSATSGVGFNGSRGSAASTAAASNTSGGDGGQTPFGGRGAGGAAGAAGGAASSGSGGGGGGAGATGAFNATGGGGSAAYITDRIVAPAATYTYTVGAGGAAGTAGAGGLAGGAGAAGTIFVLEYYK